MLCFDLLCYLLCFVPELPFRSLEEYRKERVRDVRHQNNKRIGTTPAKINCLSIELKSDRPYSLVHAGSGILPHVACTLEFLLLGSAGASSKTDEALSRLAAHHESGPAALGVVDLHMGANYSSQLGQAAAGKLRLGLTKGSGVGIGKEAAANSE